MVGISHYDKWPDLPNAGKDAQEVTSNLRKLGFEVKLVLDPTSNELRSILSDLVYDFGKEENRALLFYYAGHGETVGLADGTELGYIVPSDSPLKSKDPVGFDNKAISMKVMEVLALKVKSKHFIMLFDSCFSGSIFNLVRAAPVDISEKSALPGRQFITAGGAGEQVPDQSVFKVVFSRRIGGDADLNADGYVTGSEPGMHLQEKVVNYTRAGQHPQYGKINNPKLDRGDFIFVPLKTRQLEMAEAQKLQEEKSDIAQELKELREERRKSEALVQQMKQLLEAKWNTEDKAKESLKEKEGLEEVLRPLKRERQKDKELTAIRVKELEAKRKAAEAKLRREATQRAALEEELKRLKSEMATSSQKVRELQTKKEARLAYVPKEVKEPKIQRVTLRSSPKPVWDSDIENMIRKYNFFVKHRNDDGDFPNDFVDNGDGTVTDRVTGLMWEKGESSSKMYWRSAKGYVSRLNKEKFLGYDDWRIPTTEELASLLEGVVNRKGRYIAPIFQGRQKVCWTSDSETGWGSKNRVVDFSTGSIEYKRARSGGARAEGRSFIRAVRTIPESGESKTNPAQTEHLAYIPRATKTPYDILRYGKGPFPIDDFEDKDLWSASLHDNRKHRTRGQADMEISADPSQGANGTSGSMKIKYDLKERSFVLTVIGAKSVRSRINEVENDRSKAYDLSRFNRVTFYLKGEKGKSFFSRPNKLFVAIGCYGERIRASYGDKYADYYNRAEIVPDTEWKKVEIPLDDFIPSARTKHKATNFPANPDLHNVLLMYFMFSSFKGHEGSPGSNTVWIDEIRLE